MNNLPVLYTIPIWKLIRGSGDNKEIFIPWIDKWINYRWVRRKVPDFNDEYYYQRWILNKTVKSEYVIPKCLVCKAELKYNLFGNHHMTCSQRCKRIMVNTFPEYEETRIKMKENNPVLQEGGLTNYLKNHPEKGLDNRLKAFKERRTGFGYMHDNESSRKKWLESMKPFYESGGSLRIIYDDPNRREKILLNNRSCNQSSVSKISIRCFEEVKSLFADFGVAGEMYFNTNEYRVPVIKSNGRKTTRLLDFYSEGLGLIMEFMGSYYHPRDSKRFTEDEINKSVDNDYDRMLEIYTSLSKSHPRKVFYLINIYEGEYRDEENKDMLMTNLRNMLEQYLITGDLESSGYPRLVNLNRFFKGINE